MTDAIYWRICVSALWVLGTLIAMPEWHLDVGVSLMGIALFWNRWHLTIRLQDDRP